ncbi:hypothetical protein PG984_015390 [Apiospora sp. TS-2023a]
MDALTTEQFTLLGIALAVIISRTWWRLRTMGIKGLQADDYLMIVAACAYSCETYLAYSVGKLWHGLANNGMTDNERRLLDPSSEEYRLRVGGSKTQLAGWNTYTFLLWTLKSAVCTYYIRLTDGLEFQKRIYAGFVLIVTTWIAAHLSIFLGCLPLKKNWQIYPDPGIHCQPAISGINVFVVFVLNVVTDIYLLTIPIPLLWKSKIKPIKKAALIVMFSGGVFVTAAGTLRAVLIVTVSFWQSQPTKHSFAGCYMNPVTGAQQAGSWAIRETFVAVITANLPIIFPMFRLWLAPVIRSVRKSVDSSAKSSGAQRLNDVELENRHSKRGKGPRSVNPLPSLTTFNESEERLNQQR